MLDSMPYEYHTELSTPSDDTILWRYMDFARFVNLLDERTLWFSRADQFEDPLEGSHTDAELAVLSTLPLIPETNENMGAQYIRMANAMRKAGFISCWRADSSESLAMWDLYGKGSGIVAIKTTVGRLKAQFARIEHRVFLAKVKYVDWGSLPGDDGNALVMYTRKDLSYTHETEVRAIIWGILSFPQKYEAEASNVHAFGNVQVLEKEIPPLGVTVPIEPAELITEVIVGPREKPWVRGLVENVLRRYGLSISVSSSNRLTPR